MLLERFKKNLNTFLSRFGFEIRRVLKDKQESGGFVLYRYLKEDGSFDYEQYRKVQVAGNKNKIGYVAVVEENVAFLSEYIKNRIPTPQFGICHGTRRGKEQEWFRKYLGCEVIGTEISDTAETFPHTIQWDFHDTKPEWIDAVDFIYSNSFDHSFDPEQCLTAWTRCLKKEGLCILEHGSFHEPEAADGLDPFGANLSLMPYLITTWGRGKFGVREILSAPAKSEGQSRVDFIVIQRF